MDLFWIIGFVIVTAVLLRPHAKPYIKSKAKYNKTNIDVQTIVHSKKTHLTTDNEQKLFYALRKVLGDCYMIHC